MYYFTIYYGILCCDKKKKYIYCEDLAQSIHTALFYFQWLMCTVKRKILFQLIILNDVSIFILQILTGSVV